MKDPEVGVHALDCSNLEKLFAIDLPNAGYNQRPTLLIDTMKGKGVMNFDFIVFCELKIGNDCIYLVFTTPLDEINEHGLHVFVDELARPTKPQYVIVIPLAFRV
jgi:hypothetical protein